MQNLRRTLTNSSRSFMQAGAPRRFFSSPAGPSGSNLLSMALLGTGTAGLTYLMYKGMQLSGQRTASPMMAKQMHQFDPIVQQRIRNTLMYFGTGLAATGVLVKMMSNNMFALNHPWMMLFGSLGFMIGTMFTNY